MENHFGTLYHVLKSHKAVEDFAFYLGLCVKYPELHNPILVSMGNRLHTERKALSVKQISYARALIEKEKG